VVALIARSNSDELGFVWDEFARQWEVVKEALAIHMTAKQSFAVPKGEERPEDAWGVEPGHAVDNRRPASHFANGDPEGGAAK
jgi:hypothetical protein